MKLKIKISLVALSIAMSSLPLLAALPQALVAAAPSAELIQQCYTTYNGHGSGSGTDNKLVGDLAASYATSSCDSTKGGPCVANGASQGVKLTCTAPAGAAGADDSSTAQDCSKYGLTASPSNDACVYNPNNDTAADPALKGCTDSSNVNSQDCDIIHKYVNPLIQVLSASVGVAVAAAIVYGGILYSTSSGDAGKVGKAKNLIRNAVLALIAYIFFYSFIQFLIPGGIFH